MSDVPPPPPRPRWNVALVAGAFLGAIVTSAAGAVLKVLRRAPRSDGAPSGATGGVGLDPLTRLLTREGLARAYAALAPQTPCALVMMDLNDLKAVNDLGGHGAGDAHIRAVADALVAAFPTSALLCRWGGDEFVAILPGVDPQEGRVFAEHALERAPEWRPSHLAFSFGVAALRAPEPLERAIVVADSAMYEAKTARGRGDGLAVEDVVRRLQDLRRVQDVLGEGLDLVRDLLGFQGGAVFSVRGDHLTLLEVRGALDPEARAAADALRRLDVRLSRAGDVLAPLRQGSTVSVADFSSLPDLPDGAAGAALARHGLKSFLIAPVRFQGELEWLLCLFSFDTWRTVTPQARRVAEVLALRAAHVLELDRVARRLHETLAVGLLGLGVALEARELEVTGHTDRVVARAQRLGEALGLSHAELGELRQGAYLHDIGKLAVPDQVLLKRGTLSPEELELMRTHAERGAFIASRIPGLSGGALDVILHHHERWDGEGYPDGLAGEDIPLLARIFSVVDVYDALTGERPYDAPWTPEEALRELRAQAGRQFDPRVVEAFVRTVAPEYA